MAGWRQAHGRSMAGRAAHSEHAGWPPPFPAIAFNVLVTGRVAKDFNASMALYRNSTLLIPTNILFEAALNYLGAGLYVPTPTWGQMLSSAVVNQYYLVANRRGPRLAS